MCLCKTHNEPKIAHHDIEVWKILTDKGLSPYLDYQYHPGMNKPACAKTMPVPVEQQHIRGGYLHAYVSHKRAEEYTVLLQKIPPKIFEDYVVQRMLIPKGSIYYEGANDDICAECLYWPEEDTVHPNPIKIMEI